VIQSLVGTVEICKNCSYFRPDLGHGGWPSWNGPCVVSKWRKNVRETDNCKNFSWDVENKRDHPDDSRE